MYFKILFLFCSILLWALGSWGGGIASYCCFAPTGGVMQDERNGSSVLMHSVREMFIQSSFVHTKYSYEYLLIQLLGNDLFTKPNLYLSRLVYGMPLYNSFCLPFSSIDLLNSETHLSFIPTWRQQLTPAICIMFATKRKSGLPPTDAQVPTGIHDWMRTWGSSPSSIYK